MGVVSFGMEQLLALNKGEFLLYLEMIIGLFANGLKK